MITTRKQHKDFYSAQVSGGEYRAVAVALQRDIAGKNELLREALEAMLNLAPRIKNDRDGCFGDGGKDCVCTACKIRRELAE